MKFKALLIVASLVLSAGLASCGTEVLKDKTNDNPNAKSSPPAGKDYLKTQRYPK